MRNAPVEGNHVSGSYLDLPFGSGHQNTPFKTLNSHGSGRLMLRDAGSGANDHENDAQAVLFDEGLRDACFTALPSLFALLLGNLFMQPDMAERDFQRAVLSDVFGLMCGHSRAS